MKTHVITAMKQDERGTHCFTMRIQALDSDIDVLRAVKEASNEYIHTPEGEQVYKQYGNDFNWIDFWNHVPDHICKNHGITRVTADRSDIVTDWNERLAAL